ncbi:MAG: hypothetical protein IKA12_00250 [Clostridia bacterium]|nr:hypothetical protein [Clostridia bacterium]
MTRLTVSENYKNYSNVEYVKNSLSEILTHTKSSVTTNKTDDRLEFIIECSDGYSDIIKSELIDKIAEIIAINYKYNYYKNQIKIAGLTPDEKEILYASLIAADLDADKKYCYNKCKEFDDIAIDGAYNFYLSPLKKKWEDVVSYMPTCFINSQLKDFITYLLENKKKKIYIDGEKVFDTHFRRLKRSDLLGGENVKIIREVLLSNCGEIELSGTLPADDEKYLKEFYGDKITFSQRYWG